MTVDNTPSDNQRTAQERDVPRAMKRFTTTFAAETEKRVILPYDVKVMGIENAIATDILFYVTKIDSTTTAASLVDPVITSSDADTIPASGVFPVAQQTEFNCVVLKAGSGITGAVTFRIGDGLPNGLGGTVATAELTAVA